MKPPIEIEVEINKGVAKVWDNFIMEESVKKWNHASDDWECPSAINDFRVGGKFSYIMSTKDGSNSFDMWGEYTDIDSLKSIKYTLGDGRNVEVHFEMIDGNTTKVRIIFETETDNSLERQRQGWQAILNNFKKYCEEN